MLLVHTGADAMCQITTLYSVLIVIYRNYYSVNVLLKMYYSVLFSNATHNFHYCHVWSANVS